MDLYRNLWNHQQRYGLPKGGAGSGGGDWHVSGVGDIGLGGQGTSSAIKKSNPPITIQDPCGMKYGVRKGGLRWRRGFHGGKDVERGVARDL